LVLSHCNSYQPDRDVIEPAAKKRLCLKLILFH
jgi:hypothetical protein